MKCRIQLNYVSPFQPFLVILALFLLSSNVSLSQSDNYWSWNFNTPSTLLAGSVVGGSAGPSAVFYNPSLIDHENVPSLSLSASIVSLQFFNAYNIAGEGIDADKFIFKIQPRFLSYVLPSKNEQLGMEAAILSPVSEEIEYTIQHFDELDIIQRTAGEEIYSGYLKYSRKYDDTWAGFGFSYRLNDQLYVGLSSFLSVKILKYEYRQRAQAHQEGDSVTVGTAMEPRYIAESSFEEEAKYWDLSFIFKGGAQYRSKNDRFSLGANVTFPSIRFIGQADVRKSFSRSNVYDNVGDSFTSNDILIEVENKVRTRVKTPFSTAIGFQYFTKSRKNSVSFTFEYFHEIDPYAIININRSIGSGGDYYDQVIDPSDFLSYYHSAQSVSNAGLGFKQYISPSLFFLGGFRTDFTSGTDDDIRFVGDKFKINQIHLDKYHITLGPVLQVRRFNVVTGVQYTFGRNRELNPVINYANPVEYIPQTGQSLQGLRENQASARINEIALFFGLTVDIIKSDSENE